MPPSVPLVGYLNLSDDSLPHLVARRCEKCGALFFDRRNACASCGGVAFESATLDRRGTLASYTIVHRAAPNVPVPYVSAVVELNGGGVIKANLVDVAPEPSAIVLGSPVELVTFVAGVDDDGTEAVAFGFRPIEDKEVPA